MWNPRGWKPAKNWVWCAFLEQPLKWSVHAPLLSSLLSENLGKNLCDYNIPKELNLFRLFSEYFKGTKHFLKAFTSWTKGDRRNFFFNKFVPSIISRQSRLECDSTPIRLRRNCVQKNCSKKWHNEKRRAHLFDKTVSVPGTSRPLHRQLLNVEKFTNEARWFGSCSIFFW